LNVAQRIALFAGIVVAGMGLVIGFMPVSVAGTSDGGTIESFWDEEARGSAAPHCGSSYYPMAELRI
jgi:hypothetical protein